MLRDDPTNPEPFFVQANCLDSSWSLRSDEWKFVFNEKSRRCAVDYGRETPPPTPTFPARSAVTATARRRQRDREKQERLEESKESKDTLESPRSMKSKDKEKEKKEEKIVFDPSRPSWTMKFVLDMGDDLELRQDTESDDAIKAEVMAAMARDPTILLRGKEFREDYLRKSAFTGFLGQDSAEYPRWTATTMTTDWPRPSKSLPVSFDMTTFIKSSDEVSQELDLFLHQNKLRDLEDHLDLALTIRAAALGAEKKLRDVDISSQNALLKNMMDTTISERRKYAAQRDIFKKMLEDEEGRVGLLAATEMKPKKKISGRKKIK